MTILNGFITMVIIQIWKWMIKKFGIETSRLIIHGGLFIFSLSYATSKYWGDWRLLLSEFSMMWALASGTYEILVKTLIPIIPIVIEKIKNQGKQ